MKVATHGETVLTSRLKKFKVDEIASYAQKSNDRELLSLADNIKDDIDSLFSKIRLSRQQGVPADQLFQVDPSEVEKIKGNVNYFWAAVERKIKEKEAITWDKRKFIIGAIGATIIFAWGIPGIAESVTEYFGLKEKVQDQAKTINQQNQEKEKLLNIISEGGKVLTDENGKVIEFQLNPSRDFELDRPQAPKSPAMKEIDD